MLLKTFLRANFVRASLEYVTNKIIKIPERGEDKILARVEKYRLQLELCNYFIQQLEIAKNNVILQKPLLGGLCIQESATILTFKRQILNNLVLLRQLNVDQPKVFAYVERNSISIDRKDLMQLYEGNLHERDLLHCINLIDNHLKHIQQ